jgi:iron-sulfur cluster assembly accessory protein
MKARQFITASKLATDKLQDILQKSNKNAILFYVKGGGCNGFNYNLKPTNESPDKLDEVVRIDNVEIHICNSSIMHLLGTHIDWKEDIMGQGFHFENPMAQSKCGCGTSFSSHAIN